MSYTKNSSLKIAVVRVIKFQLFQGIIAVAMVSLFKKNPDSLILLGLGLRAFHLSNPLSAGECFSTRLAERPVVLDVDAVFLAAARGLVTLNTELARPGIMASVDCFVDILRKRTDLARIAPRHFFIAPVGHAETSSVDCEFELRSKRWT